MARSAWRWLALASGAAVVEPGITLVAAAWMSPAVLACIADMSPGRAVARTLVLAGVAGALPGLAALWQDGTDLTAGAHVAISPAAFALPWAAQAAGLLATQLLPVLTRAFEEAGSRARTRRLVSERDRLLTEWTLD